LETQGCTKNVQDCHRIFGTLSPLSLVSKDAEWKCTTTRIGTNKGLMVRRLKKPRGLKNSFIQLDLIVTEAM
jgi:hypothetical protein